MISTRQGVARSLSVALAGFFKKASKTHDVSRTVKKTSGYLFSNKTTPSIWVMSAKKDVPRCLSVPLAGFFKNASKTPDVSRNVKEKSGYLLLTRQPLHFSIWLMSVRKEAPRCLSVPLAGYFRNASKTHDVSRKIKKIHIGYPFSNKKTPQVGWCLPERT